MGLVVDDVTQTVLDDHSGKQIPYPYFRDVVFCSSKGKRSPVDKEFFFLGGIVGKCTKDSFQITSPGNAGSPVICGYNTGQHSEYF